MAISEENENDFWKSLAYAIFGIILCFSPLIFSPVGADLSVRVNIMRWLLWLAILAASVLVLMNSLLKYYDAVNELEGYNWGFLAFFFWYVTGTHFVLSIISYFFPMFVFVDAVNIVAEIICFTIYARILIRKEIGKKEIAEFNRNPFDSIVEKVGHLRDVHMSEKTRIAGDMDDIFETIVSLSEKTLSLSRVERSSLAARISDKVDKLAYIVGENYYLNILNNGIDRGNLGIRIVETEIPIKDLVITLDKDLVDTVNGLASAVNRKVKHLIPSDKNSRWKNRKEKMKEVENVVKTFKNQLRAHLVGVNEKTSQEAVVKLRSMVKM